MIYSTLGVYSTLYPGQSLSAGLALLISAVGFFLVFVILGLLALFVKAMGTVFDRAAKGTAKPDEVAAAQVPFPSDSTGAHPLPDNTAAGDLILQNVSEEEAAVLMAIVSNRSGIPLNRLQFHVIRRLEDDAE